MERYSSGSTYKHYSEKNNYRACMKVNGKWVMFSNFLEKMPQHKSRSSCLAASTPAAPTIWDIPYRSADIDERYLPKQCLVKLPPPKCKLAPYSRSNHLGNGEGTNPLTFDWLIPYFPSKQTQRCVLRIRYGSNFSVVSGLYVSCDVTLYGGHSG